MTKKISVVDKSKKMKNGIYFITGIDTDVGKTVTTGILAKNLLQLGKTVITQKIIQTGCQNISDDIVLHRQLMKIPLQDCDLSKTTMPAIFSYPASPHLAAKIEHRTINLALIEAATQELKKQYDIVLIEGSGGIMVPITEDCLFLDYLKKHQYPLILVTNSKLGSINHTLLNLFLIKIEQLPLYAMVYNHYCTNSDAVIKQDTGQYLKKYLMMHFPEATWIDIPYTNL